MTIYILKLQPGFPVLFRNLQQGTKQRGRTLVIRNKVSDKMAIFLLVFS